MKVVRRAGNCPPYATHNIQKEVDRLDIFFLHSGGMHIGLDKYENVHFLDFRGRKSWKSKRVKIIWGRGKYRSDDLNNLQKELGLTRDVRAYVDGHKS